MNYSDFRSKLAAFAEDEYRTFSSKGIPTDRPILGVRIPKVREITRAIPASDLPDLIKETPIALEEVIARGFMICRYPYDKMLPLFDSQIEYIDNWCSCDIFCSALRPVIKKHLPDFLDTKIEPLLTSKEEFSVRAGLVLLFSYVTPDYLALIYDRVESLAGREEYYIKMAIAWLIAECFIKFPDETLSYLKVSHLPKWTFNKTISKICDSYRVDKETKTYLRTLRK